MHSRWYARPTVSTSVTAPSRVAWRPERVTHSPRPQRPGHLPDLILGSALGLGLFLVGVLAAGGGLELCPPQLPAELAQAIGRALDRRDAIDRSALAARARERFGYAAIGQTWTQIYQDLAHGHTGV